MSVVRHGLRLLVPALVGSSVAAEEYLTVEQALALAFPDAQTFARRALTVPQAARERLARELRSGRAPRLVSVHEARRGETVLGYALVGNVKGKSLPITWMLAVGPDLATRSIEILVYRESHGYEVRHARFRQQFVGATSATPLVHKRDIRNVAGATISCRALTDGVHDTLRVLAAVLEKRAAVEAATPAASTPADGIPATLERARVLMGTTLRLTVHATDRAAAEQASELAFAEVARLEALWSRFRDESEVSLLVRRAGGEPLAIAPETRALLDAARAFERKLGGALDVGASALELDAARGTARFPAAGARLDLGAVGKGAALDRAAAILRRSGVRSALLDFGGMLLALGPRPDGTPWPVTLRDPRDPERTLATLALVRGALATSASYERGAHVLDPRTGAPVVGTRGASAWAERALDADALSTAMFVLGHADGLALAREAGHAVWIVDGDASGKSPAFERAGLLVDDAR